MRKFGALACALMTVLTLASCGRSQPPVYPFGNDVAHTGTQNTAVADEITMPDGYVSIMTKCDHGNRVYLAKGSTVPQIQFDAPSCAEPRRGSL